VTASGKNVMVAMFEKKNCGWPDYVWLKGTAYDSVVGKSGKQRARNMNMDIRVPNFDLHVGKGQLLLDNAELNISYGTRYGIIGRNGIGKSVLLRAISSREGPFACIPTWYSILHVEQEIVGDERSPLEVVLASDRERLWLVQEAKRLEAEAERKDAAVTAGNEAEEDSDEDEEDFQRYDLKDIYERLREIEAHKAESRASAILSGLQFDDAEMRSKPSKEYSGGWRMRISLARALFMTPELLILDEPSNHLDLSAAVWLEHYLSSYKKTLLLVSHDESMLNECVDSIVHFFNHKVAALFVGGVLILVPCSDSCFAAVSVSRQLCHVSECARAKHDGGDEEAARAGCEN
jgi:ATPase subunit of ABC transporter with duplicated ATPase domains